MYPTSLLNTDQKKALSLSVENQREYSFIIGFSSRLLAVHSEI